MATPTISTVIPAFGPAIGGTPVVITGTNFTADAVVTFGGLPASDVVITPSTSISCTSPTKLGVMDVVVTEAGGTATASGAYTGTAMPVELTCLENPGLNYAKYLYENPVKQDRDGDTILLNFSLADVDANFIQLRRGNYITFTSQTYPLWYSGYILTEPEYIYLGEAHGVPHWGFRYQATSDEYILSQNPIGIISPFLNMTQGQIIKALVNIIAPELFDTVNVQDGLTLARFVVDPTQKFADIIKVFAQTAVYRFYGQGHKLFYTPKTELPVGLTIDGMGERFTPSTFAVKASTSIPIINDCVVMGDIEPQRYTREYFLGDGFTGEFPLTSSVFGVESVIILDDSFSSSTIDSSKWTLYDTPTNYLTISNGFLNCTGGTADGTYAVHLDSISLLALAGNMRFAHGEFDFVPQNEDNTVTGVICGLWTQEPNSSYTGCVYGIQVQKTSGVVYLNPIVNGAVDTTQTQIVATNGQSGNPAPWNATVSYAVGNNVTYSGQFYVCIATTSPGITPLNGAYWAVAVAKRYVIRTIVSTNTMFAKQMTYNHLDANGILRSNGGAISTLSDLSFHTYITELDPNTGLITPGYPIVWSNFLSPTIEKLYCLYILLASDKLHATVTGLTISTPMQCTLGLQEFNQVSPVEAAGFVNKLVGPNEIDATDGLAPYATVSQSGGKQTKSNILGTPQYNLGSPNLQFFKDTSRLTSTVPQEGDIIRLDYRSAGAALGRSRSLSSIETEKVNWQDSGVRSVIRNQDLNPLPQTSADCIAAAASIIGQNAFTHYEGTYIVPSQNVTAEPLAGAILTVYDLTSDFPVSSFVEPISMVSTSFDGWNGLLEVFTHTVTYGLKNDSVRLLTVLAGFQKQSNVFTVTDTTEVPDFIPTTGVGLSFAPDVTMPSMDPTCGGTFGFWQANYAYTLPTTIIDINGNLQKLLVAGTSGLTTPSWANAHNNAVPIGSVVTSTFVSVTTDIVTITSPVDVTGMLNIGTQLLFSGFSSALFLNGQTLSVLTIDGTTFTVALVTPDYAQTSDVGIGTVTASGGLPLTTPDGSTVIWSLIGHAYGVDATHFYFDMGTTPPTLGSFEVRYTDDGWGCDSGSNLASRFTTQTFSLPRITRNSVIFIKEQDGRNRMESSELWVASDGSNRYGTSPTASPWQTQGSFNGFTDYSNWVLVQGLDSDYNLRLLNSMVMRGYHLSLGDFSQQEITIAAVYGDQFTVSFDFKGPKGEWLQVELYASTPVNNIQAMQLTGMWQRLTITATAPSVPTGGFTSGNNLIFTFKIQPAQGGLYGAPVGYVWPLVAPTVYGTRASFEKASAETFYCKTVDAGTANIAVSPYGADSQYAASIHCGFPYVPDPPTGYFDYTDAANPIINIVLPSVADNVWGVEVRASDNVTVLYQSNLTDAGYAPAYTVVNNTSRSGTFYLYTYNLLGEYSASYTLPLSIPAPTISGLGVDDATKTLFWTGTGVNYEVDIDSTSSSFGPEDTVETINVTTTSTVLSDNDFFNVRYFKVTPMDGIGPGTPATLTHSYTASTPPTGIPFYQVNSKAGWTVAAYGTQRSGYPATNAIDGNVNTIWSSNAGGSDYIEINFGSSQTFSIVELTNRPTAANNDNRGQPHSFEIQTSPDGSAWTSQGIFSGPQNIATTNAYTLSGAPVTAHYLKIIVSTIWGTGNVVIAEIYTVYAGAISGVVPPSSPGNIPLPGGVGPQYSADYTAYVDSIYGTRGLTTY